MWSPVIVTSLLASYAAAETCSLGLEKLIIKDPALPPAFHNFQVIFITDIHHGPYSSVRRLQHMVQRINTLQPDLILYGGDFLQTRRRPRQKLISDYYELLDILRRLHTPSMGSYAVLGNHDYVFSEEYNRRQLARAGIKLLVNQGVWLEKGQDRIRLDGVGDLWYGQPNLAQTHADVPATAFTLLVSHQPNFIDQLHRDEGINFVLAGHTHGSQIKVFNYQPVMPQRIARWEYSAGLIETPQTRMLVSPGVGTEIPYFRFFSPPKIHLLTFKSAPRFSKFSP